MSSVEMAASIGAMIVHAASARGVDPQVLRRSTGFDPQLALDPDARIPLALEEALWNEAARLTGDDALGLHAAQGIQPGVFDVLDYAVRSAPTLRASLERLIRYNRLVHDAAEFKLLLRGDAARIEHAFRVRSAIQCRHSAEFTIAAVLVFASQITGKRLAPLAVELRHARPDAPAACAELERFFGLSPRFGQPVNAIELPASALDLELPASDPALSRIVERHAEALLAQLPALADTMADRVRRVLSAALGEGSTSLAAIARKLKTSERTLQRKLADEGVSYDALLDDVRRELAVRYLSDRKLAIAEVAYLLGYSEPSPFHRAFKRWTGLTPSEARKSAA